MNKRVGSYGGRIIITDGESFGAFWTAKKYATLDDVMTAIDNGTIDSGRHYDDNRIMTMENMI